MRLVSLKPDAHCDPQVELKMSTHTCTLCYHYERCVSARVHQFIYNPPTTIRGLSPQCSSCTMQTSSGHPKKENL